MLIHSVLLHPCILCAQNCLCINNLYGSVHADISSTYANEGHFSALLTLLISIYFKSLMSR
jgi:hypothetical protein